MNNLRKVLALVLVVATLMGFASMATAAKFADAETIVNEEAVDLLTALKVIEGREDGKFDPTATVTRGEMAKMIAVMVNGGEFDAKAYVDACEYADTKGHWSAGYVAYCDAVNIIDGYPDGTFKPDQKVKVVEAAKMILAALGYEATNAGYTGAKWDAEVTADADDRDILDNVAKLPSEYADRDTAALMMYNGLQATMVDWDDDYIFVTDDKVTVVGKYENRTWSKDDDTNKKGDTIELYEEAFEGALIRTPGEGYANIGEFMAPAVVWFFKGEPICITYADAKAVYNTAVDYKTIAKEVGNPKTVNVYVDGLKDADLSTAAAAGLKVKALSSASKKTVGAQGTVTEVYLEGGDMSIIVKNTYVGSVTITNDQKEVDLFSVKAKVDNDLYIAKDFDNEELKYAKDTIVLFNRDYVGEGKYEIKNVYAPKVQTLVNNLFDGVSGNTTVATITLGDKSYKFNKNALVVTDVLASVDEAELYETIGESFNVWFDEFGNVAYMTQQTAKVPYTFAYVLAARTVVDSWDSENVVADVYEAKLLLTDGTIKTVETTEPAVVGQLFAYDIVDGKYDLYKPNFDGEYSAKTGKEIKAPKYVAAELANGTDVVMEILNNSTMVWVDENGDEVYFENVHTDCGDQNLNASMIVNNKTVFIVEVKENVYKVFEGVENVPAVKAEKVAVAYQHKDTVADDKLPSADNRAYDVAKYVFVLNTEAIEAPEGTGIIAVTGNDYEWTTKWNGVETTFYKVNAVLDGKVVELKVTEAVYNTLATGANYFSGLNYSEDGYVIGVVALTGAVEYEIDVKYTDGVVLGKLAGALDTRFIAGNVPAYVYSNSGKNVKVSTISDLTADFAGYAFLDAAGKVVLFIGADK